MTIVVNDVFGGTMTPLGGDIYSTVYGQKIDISKEEYDTIFQIKDLDRNEFISVKEYNILKSIDNRNEKFGNLFL